MNTSGCPPRQTIAIDDPSRKTRGLKERSMSRRTSGLILLAVCPTLIGCSTEPRIAPTPSTPTGTAQMNSDDNSANDASADQPADNPPASQDQTADPASAQTESPAAYNELTPAEEYVILNKGTERPFVGKFTNLKDQGTFICRRCACSSTSRATCCCRSFRPASVHCTCVRKGNRSEYNLSRS